MKMPEFIPFHFDKFNQNLFRKHGAVGVGRWLLVKKAVAETPTLTINLNDISDRETLELDSGCSESELTELLDYAAQRGMIDAQLYGNGILWIENLDTDLGRFFKAGKRHLPKRPQLHGKIPLSSGDFSEKFQEVEQDAPNISEKFLEVGEKVGIPTHETKRNETNERNEHVREKISSKVVQPPKVEEPRAARQDDDGLDEETRIYLEQQKLIAATVPKFFEAYGKTGSPKKVEQGLWEATKVFLKEYGAPFEVSINKVLDQAAAQRRVYKANGTEEKYMKSPENWLDEGYYNKEIEKKPKPGEPIHSESKILDRTWWTV